MNTIDANYLENISGCGTNITWTFENAKYQKGTTVTNPLNGKSGIITSSYHFGSEDTRAYFIKWEDGIEKDYSKDDVEKFIIK